MVKLEKNWGNKPKSYPNLKKHLTKRSSAIVLFAMAKMSDECKKSPSPSSIKKEIQSEINWKHTRNIRKVLSELLNDEIIIRCEEVLGRYHLLDGVKEAITDVEEAFKKVEFLEGKILNGDEVVTFILNLDPEDFFNAGAMSNLISQFDSLGFNFEEFNYQKKSYYALFINDDFELAEIFVEFKELTEKHLQKLKRPERSAIKVEIRIRIRETHHLNEMNNIQITNLKGKELNIKSLQSLFFRDSKIKKDELTKKLISHLKYSILIRILSFLYSESKLRILTLEENKKEVYFINKSIDVDELK